MARHNLDYEWRQKSPEEKEALLAEHAARTKVAYERVQEGKGEFADYFLVAFEDAKQYWGKECAP